MSEGDVEQIELALADLKMLYQNGEATVDGVQIDLLEGAEVLLREGYEERYMNAEDNHSSS